MNGAPTIERAGGPMRPRHALVVALCLAAAACDEPAPRTYTSFMEDRIAREGTLTRCRENPQIEQSDIECANARRAESAIALRQERERRAALEAESERKLAALRAEIAARAEAALAAQAAAAAALEAAYEAQWAAGAAGDVPVTPEGLSGVAVPAVGTSSGEMAALEVGAGAAPDAHPTAAQAFPPAPIAEAAPMPASGPAPAAQPFATSSADPTASESASATGTPAGSAVPAAPVNGAVVLDEAAPAQTPDSAGTAESAAGAIPRPFRRD
jgi:hypothetical protein